MVPHFMVLYLFLIQIIFYLDIFVEEFPDTFDLRWWFSLNILDSSGLSAAKNETTLFQLIRSQSFYFLTFCSLKIFLKFPWELNKYFYEVIQEFKDPLQGALSYFAHSRPLLPFAFWLLSTFTRIICFHCSINEKFHWQEPKKIAFDIKNTDNPVEPCIYQDEADE